MIKKDNKFITSQIIYFFALKQTLKQPKKFRDIALKNITKNCYGLMPENVVFSLTQSNETDIRNKGMRKVLEIRGASPFKSEKRIPKIKVNTERWSDFIDLETEGIAEPPFIMAFSSEELFKVWGKVGGGEIACTLTEC